MSDTNATVTGLLTLLNVSATKSTKRKISDTLPVSSNRLNKRRVTVSTVDEIRHEVSTEPLPNLPHAPAESLDMDNAEDSVASEDDSESTSSSKDSYSQHFASNTTILGESSKLIVEKGSWKTNVVTRGQLGSLVEYVPETSESRSHRTEKELLPKLRDLFRNRHKSLSTDVQSISSNLLSELAAYRDIFLNKTSIDVHDTVRDTVSVHVLNHVMKKRRTVLKNNERLSNASKKSTEPPSDIQDQGFTRPSVLILVPFRSFALRWMNSLTSFTPSPDFQIENHSRFVSEYGLPPDSEDKLESAPPGTHPVDHVHMFKGNMDDSFRVGIKMTRKSVKLFADFYQCDVILASPLGLRMSIEKEHNSDFLSSIEVVILDQMDAFTMQNWEHLQFVLSDLNQLPKETRDADFSRIMAWYLNGDAAHLRQSILISPYETPSMRSLFNNTLKNVAGKSRLETRFAPVQVPEGIKQTFDVFDCTNPQTEFDQRFAYFSTKLLPKLLKSAVQSSNTVIFVPSSFDFIRVHNHFRKLSSVSFTVLSEYSTNQDISRARQAFFSGRKSFLLVSERFHFFRRYKIRGIRNLVFYGPPDHAQFYTEFLSYPFLDEGVEGSDVTCQVLCCRYDLMSLERVIGTEEAVKLLKTQ